MREILFRGKRKDNGEWVQGHNVFYMQSNDNVFITQTGLPVPTLEDSSSVVVMMHPSTEVWIDTVCQFTGLTDKNGKKIFEGDILVIRNCREHPVLVKFVEFSWQCVITNVNAYIHYRHRLENNETMYEVIGNIHDNPELLEG